MPLGARRQFFFAHIMKTAGTNFLEKFVPLFAPDRVWPAFPRDWMRIDEYLSVRRLTAMDEQERRRLQLVCGHLPFSTAELLGGPDVGDEPACLTILRDPVPRTVSFLEQCRRTIPEFNEQSLEAIYDEWWYFRKFIADHQTRMLSMTLDEALGRRDDEILFADFFRSLVPETASRPDRAAVDALLAAPHPQLFDNLFAIIARLDALGADTTDAIVRFEALTNEPEHRVPPGAFGYVFADAAMVRRSPVSAERLQVAMENIDRCAVVGVTEHYEAFVGEVNRQFGLDCSPGGRTNASPPSEPQPRSFLRRIADDNRFDAELHERARTIVARRTAAA
jgi:hypothetical protein